MNLALALAAELFHKQGFYEALVNMPGLTWTPGISERFVDKTVEEMKSLVMAERPQVGGGLPVIRAARDTPEALSWLDQKPECVREVRDQEGCGACWAFATTNMFGENRCFAGHDKRRVMYSEQYMVSCDSANLGCCGGQLSTAAEFVVRTGLPTDSCVSYQSGATGQATQCPTACDDNMPIRLTKGTSAYIVEANNPEAIKAALQGGAVTAAVQIFNDFFYYTGGIYQHVYGPFAGWHAVMLLGYGEENSVKYWVGQNSWGPNWGENGFFRILRGANECRIEELQVFLDA